MKYIVKDPKKRRAVAELFGVTEIESYNKLGVAALQAQIKVPSFNPWCGLVSGLTMELEPVVEGDEDKQMELSLDEEML